MSIFKRLFGRDKSIEQNKSIKNNDNFEELSSLPQKDQDLFLDMMNKISADSVIETNTPELFKSEIYDSLNRYYSSPELTIKLNLTDKHGNSLKEHEAFDFTFGEWKKINSIWDRRAVLFEHWDETEFKNLQKWQILERFIKDRYALKAIDFQKSDVTENDFQDIRLIVALSKLYRALDSIPQAEHYAKGAYKLRPDLDIVKVEYANVLHLSVLQEEKDLSHKLIDEIIENKIKKSNEKEISLLNFFVFSEDYIDSSIYAANFLNVGECDSEAWDKLAEEYYWCPIFRFEHSKFLSKNGDSLKALAKLDSLANEFPWFKSGVLANIDAIKQLRVQRNEPNLMNEEMSNMERFKAMWEQ